jgi:hypothetical protein
VGGRLAGWVGLVNLVGLGDSFSRLRYLEEFQEVGFLETSNTDIGFK